jgi:hypothetical protein
LISTISRLLYDFISEEGCKCTFKKYGNEQKDLEKDYIWLKVIDEKSRIRIRKSDVRIHGSGSVLKYHGSGTIGAKEI